MNGSVEIDCASNCPMATVSCCVEQAQTRDAPRAGDSMDQDEISRFAEG
jgi:hypothetical protein